MNSTQKFIKIIVNQLWIKKLTNNSTKLQSHLEDFPEIPSRKNTKLVTEVLYKNCLELAHEGLPPKIHWRIGLHGSPRLTGNDSRKIGSDLPLLPIRISRSLYFAWSPLYSDRRFSRLSALSRTPSVSPSLSISFDLSLSSPSQSHISSLTLVLYLFVYLGSTRRTKEEEMKNQERRRKKKEPGVWFIEERGSNL